MWIDLSATSYLNTTVKCSTAVVGLVTKFSNFAVLALTIYDNLRTNQILPKTKSFTWFRVTASERIRIKKRIFWKIFLNWGRKNFLNLRKVALSSIFFARVSCTKIDPERNRCWKYVCICWIQLRYFACEGKSHNSFFLTCLTWLISHSSTLRTRVNRVQTLVTGRVLWIRVLDSIDYSICFQESFPFPSDKIRLEVQCIILISFS